VRWRMIAGKGKGMCGEEVGVEVGIAIFVKHVN